MYARDFLKFTWGGSLYTDEIWANGLNLAAGDGSVLSNLDNLFNAAFLTTIKEIIETQHKSISGPGTGATLEWAKLAWIGRDGKYVYDAIYGEDSTPATGGGVSGVPFQNTAAITFRTGFKRGPAAHGRIYPPINATVGANGKITDSKTQTLATSWATTIRQINAAAALLLADNVAVSVVSKVGDGAVRAITSVDVGNVIDTQRNRRNQITEIYTSSTV